MFVFSQEGEFSERVIGGRVGETIAGWKKCVHCGRHGYLANACTDCLDEMSKRILARDPEAHAIKPGRVASFSIPPTQWKKTC